MRGHVPRRVQRDVQFTILQQSETPAAWTGRP